MSDSSTASDPDPKTTSPPGSPTAVVGAFNIPILARICDDIRATILSYRSPGPWPHLTELRGLLCAFLADEDSPSMHISLETIRTCRLDRLLEDILDPHNRPRESEGADEFADLVRQACRLQKKWLSRFKTGYFQLDEERCEEMMSVGRLHGLWFCTEGRPGWRLMDRYQDSYATSMEVGMWFLNMACAYRHGMEGDTISDLRINGIRVLALLWGKEEPINSEIVKYTREGSASDVVYSLLTHVGRPCHLLRGYKLRSPFAPVVGIRYDGIYNLRSFALKLDPQTNVFRMTLTGDRAPNQVPLETLRSVPRPAELDDWRLCKRIEERKMYNAGRGHEYAEWKMQEKDDRIGF